MFVMRFVVLGVMVAWFGLMAVFLVLYFGWVMALFDTFCGWRDLFCFFVVLGLGCGFLVLLFNRGVGLAVTLC